MKKETIENINEIAELIPYLEMYGPDMGYEHSEVRTALDNAAKVVEKRTGVDIRTEEAFRNTIVNAKGKGPEQQFILAITNLTKKILYKTHDHEGQNPADYVDSLVAMVSRVDDVQRFGTRFSEFISKDTTYVSVTGSDPKMQAPNVLPIVLNRSFPLILECSNGSVDNLIYMVLDAAEAEINKKTHHGTACFNDTELALTEQELRECIESKGSATDKQNFSRPFEGYEDLHSQIKQYGPGKLALRHTSLTSLSWNSGAKRNNTKITFYMDDDKYTVNFVGKQQNNQVMEYLMAVGQRIQSKRLDKTGNTSSVMANLGHWK